MEIKRYIKTIFGNIFDRENCYVDERLVGNPLCDTRTGYLIYEDHIVAQSDEVVKLFDCFLINRHCFDNFLLANSHQKSHNKDKDLYGACWNKDGTNINAQAKYLGAGEWVLL